MVFLELTRDSRVMMGNSGSLSIWHREVQSPFELQCGSRGFLSSHCRANRPHLGVCPQILCSFPEGTGILGLHSRFTWEVRPPLEWKQRTPLSSRVATGISWSPLSGLKGVKPPEEFLERTRDCSLGSAGKKGPISR